MLKKEIIVLDKNGSFITGTYISCPSTADLVKFCSSLMTSLKHLVGKPFSNKIVDEALNITVRVLQMAKEDGTALPIIHSLAEYNNDNYSPFILRLDMLYNVSYFLEEDDSDAVSILYPDEFENGEITEFPKEFFINYEWERADKLSSSITKHLSLSHIWYNPAAEGDCYYAII